MATARKTAPQVAPEIAGHGKDRLGRQVWAVASRTSEPGRWWIVTLHADGSLSR